MSFLEKLQGNNLQKSCEKYEKTYETTIFDQIQREIVIGTLNFYQVLILAVIGCM